MDILLDSIIDVLKLIPFLFITFLLMEYLEHKTNSEKLLKRQNKVGPIIGSVIGAFPQCGFSVAATNLYRARIITIGTLISVYLSTSDEMLPVMISSKADIKLILFILLIKVSIGMICGFIIDLLLSKKKETGIKDICDEEDCDCEHGIIKSSIKHTIKTVAFIFIITLVLNIIMEFFPEKTVEKIFLKNNIFAPFLTCLIGLIPNCASSILLVELYLKKIISLGSLIAGLLPNAGVGLLVLFKTNKNIKENINILIMIYIIGVIFGIVFNFIGALL